jgi:hypothetical protein
MQFVVDADKILPRRSSVANRYNGIKFSATRSSRAKEHESSKERRYQNYFSSLEPVENISAREQRVSHSHLPQ